MFHGQYINSEAGSCFVNRDFLSQRLEPQEIHALLTLYTSGSITQKTLLDQLTEGEVLGDEFDVEEEIEATQTGGMVEMAQLMAAIALERAFVSYFRLLLESSR